MKTLRPERADLIEALVAEAPLGRITAGLLEKDEHLTDALRALFAMPLDGMHLVFCGGTSLSKAHALIERMSEDADLKIVLPTQGDTLSRAATRQRLSALKTAVATTLRGIGLTEDTTRAITRNESRYFCSEWSYARRYDSVVGLRTQLQIEMTARNPILDTTLCQIGSLADQLAGRSADTFAVPTVAVAETLAEKVLSFLRRYAFHRAGSMQQDWDAALVRHIYDVHCIHRRHPEAVQVASTAFPELTAGDQRAFGSQFPAFAVAALPVLADALRQAKTDARLHAEYTTNLIALVYGNVTPDFLEAFTSFDRVASALLATLPSPAA